MGQGFALSRRDFLKNGVQLGLSASAASIALNACERSTQGTPSDATGSTGSGATTRSAKNISGGFIGPDFASGHRLHARQSSPDKTVSRQAKIVILGAGIAGLGAAWSLSKQGVSDFVVLELEGQAGGNSRGHRINNMACPMGAHYLPVPLNPQGKADASGEGLEPVRQVLSDLGLMDLRSGRWQVSAAGERHLCHSPQERLFFKGAWHEGLLPTADLADATLQQYQRFSTLIKGFQSRGGFHMPMGVAADPALPSTQLNERLALDGLSFKAWLAQQSLDDPQLHWYLDYCCRDDYGAGLASVSAWAGVHYFASRHGFHSPGDPARDESSASNGIFTWPQGNGWLSEKIAVGLGDKIHTERLAVRVEARDRIIRVSATHGDITEQWDCEHCVMALPLFISQRLLQGADHDSNTLAALALLSAQVEHSSWIVANAYLDRELRDRGGAAPAWDNVVYGGQGLGYVNASHQSLAQSSGATVLTYYEALGAGRETRKRLLDRPWESWLTSITQEFNTAHPDFSERLRQLDIARFGHAMAVPKPGWHSEPLRKARAHLVKGGDRLSFAHSDLAGYSVFEEAFTLGARAGRRKG
jgi:NAD(P)-binding Rossmann-like domain